MKKPIVVITLLFICGIYFGYLTKIPLYLILGTSFLLWLFCLTCLLLHKFTIFIPACLSILFISLSVAYYDCRTKPVLKNSIECMLDQQKSLQRITGIIISPPIIPDRNTLIKRLNRPQTDQIVKKSNYKVSFIINADGLNAPSGWREVKGAVKVNLYLSERDILLVEDTLSILRNLVYGQEVELFGYVYPPKSPTNPGEFDYKCYLQRQIPSIRCLMTIINVNNIRFVGTLDGNFIYDFIYKLNNLLNNTVYTHAFSNSAPMISSVLLGNRVDLPEETVDNFIKTGVMHFIAISGFNVGILVFTILLPLRLLGINRILSTIVIMVVVILYAFLTGLNPPVLRASIMVIVFYISYLVYRQWDITSAIFTGIFVILLRNPADLFNVGFQLTVLATMGIIYGTTRIEALLFKTVLFVEKLQVKSERGRLHFLKVYMRKSLCVSLAAWLSTFPITAYYFHILTPFLPIVNIAVFPFFWIIIVCGIVLLTVGTICPPLATASAWLASNTDIVLESLVSLLTSIPCSYFYIIGPSKIELYFYYLFLLLILYRNYFSLELAKIVIWGLITANVFVFINMFRFHNNSLTITCLDVGHGSAVFIQFPNRKNILYDAGSWQKFDVGKYIVSPFLWNKNIKTIDNLILSHEHEDHWNGLQSIVNRFHIKSMCSQPSLFTSVAGQKVISILDKKHIQTDVVYNGNVFKGFEPAIVKILNPSCFSDKVTTSNDNSCVLKIDYLGHSILLCADIQEQGIESVLSGLSEVKSDIIQMPHHGSFISNLERLVYAVQPAYAFINSGNDSNLQKTCDMLKKYNVEILQTHKRGAITFEINKNVITYQSFCK